MAIGLLASQFPTFTNAERQFRRMKSVIAAVHRCRHSAINELEERSVAAFGGALAVPYSRCRPHAPYQAAADHSDDVELVRALPKRNAASQSRVQFLAHA